MPFTIISKEFSTNSLKSIMFLLSLLQLLLPPYPFIFLDLAISLLISCVVFSPKTKEGEPIGAFFLNYFTCEDMSIVYIINSEV